MELIDSGVGAGTAKTINRKGNHIWKDCGMDFAGGRELKHTQAIFDFDQQQRVPDSDMQPTKAASAESSHILWFPLLPRVHRAAHFSCFHTCAFSLLCYLVFIGFLTFHCTFAKAAFISCYHQWSRDWSIINPLGQEHYDLEASARSICNATSSTTLLISCFFFFLLLDDFKKCNHRKQGRAIATCF